MYQLIRYTRLIMGETKNRFQNPYFKKSTAGRPQWAGDWWAYIGTLVLLGLLTWYAVAQKQWLWLDTVQIEGNQYLTQAQVQTAVMTALNKKHWFIVPQRLYPLTNEKKLASDIITELQHYVGIAELNATTHFPDQVAVQLKERVPGYVYIVNERYYYLDEAGMVTREVQAAELDPHFPHIRERNKKRKVALNDEVLQPNVMRFIDQLVDTFTDQSKLDISEFAILPVTCQEKQYVADKIFADEIEGTKNESVKQQKKDILKRLQNNEITVDQSLSLLEEIKRAESGDANTSSDGNQMVVTWEAQYVDTACDFATVIQDIAVITQPGVEVYFDSTIDVSAQLEHLGFVLEHEDINTETIKYIDIRFEDRVYYK